MNTKNFAKSLLAGLLVVVIVFSMFSCGQKPKFDEKDYTYNTYTALSPSNWNELTYKDNNDTQLIGYLTGSFFTYDFKFDENGEIIPGKFDMQYSAATKLEDVTATYAGTEWGVPEGATSDYAFKITLRDDIKWDDGTPIKAEDFIYSMKEQLAPEFQNYRADSFYASSLVIANAQNYFKQGQSGVFAADGPYLEYTEELDSILKFTLAPASETVAAEASFRAAFGFPASYDAAATAAYLAGGDLADTAFTVDVAASMEGKTFAEIKADATMKAAWDALIGWWQTEPNEELDFFIVNYTYPEMSFEEVGLFVGDNEYELVMILATPLELINDEGNLTYHAAYEFGGLPLVHKEKYEAAKVAPTEGSTLWTSKYNSSVETTASWGPYKLESFQSGKQYVLVRNENWYGYNMEEFEGQYQTDRIVCDTIKEWNSAWLKFLAGEIDSIGIDVSVADEYKGSERAYFTPDDYVGSLQLQSNAQQLKARESEGINKTILTYEDFRKALSLSINRADYSATCTTSSLQGFGLFNQCHYYDIENGGVYRNTDEAKKALCEIYAVDYTEYENLDAAVAAITGYDLDTARALLTKAYNEALAAGDIKETDKVLLTFGTGAINEAVNRHFEYLKNSWIELVKTTPLEGRLDLEIKDFSEAWADDFRAGAYDVCMGGWSGMAWNPGGFLMAYLTDQYRYAKGWDPTSAEMTFTMVGVGEDGGDITDTMNLLEWYYCLNGYEGAKYNWSSTVLKEEQRLQLIAALEKEILKTYYVVPTYYSFGASMLSYKVDYITYEYNEFMNYGGIRYMTYNFDDAAWDAEVAKYNGELNYK